MCPGSGRVQETARSAFSATSRERRDTYAHRAAVAATLFYFGPMPKPLPPLRRPHLLILLGAMALLAVLAFELDEAVGRTEALLLLFLGVTICVTAFYGQRSLVERMKGQAGIQRLEELQRHNAALEEAIEGIATFDMSARYTWVNAKFARVLGYEPHELVGLDIRSSLVDLDHEVDAAGEDELLATGRTARHVRVRRKDGSIAHLHVVVIARGGSGGFVFLTDLTREKEAEAGLRRGEERFRLTMLATRDLIFDVDWEIATDTPWISDALHTKFGYPEGMRMTASEWIDAIHPDDSERVLVSLNNLLADAPTESWTGEYRFSRYDGSYAYVFDRTYILRAENGLPLRAVSALTDMTARRETEEELEQVSVQNRMILSSAADCLIGVDAHGRTTYVNPAAVQLLGWTAEELAGRMFHDVVNKDRDGAPASWEQCSIRQTLAHGTSVSGTATYWTKRGTSMDVELTSQAMCDAGGEIVGAVVTFRDITERLAVERMKDEFISVVSHELRTPLTSIRGSLGLISGGRVGEVPPKMRRMLEIAVSNTDRLVRLINDILDIERMASGKVTLTRQLCSAEDLIRDGVESMRLLADQAGVHIEHVPSQGVLFGDRDRLLQTLTNLIGNAIKFSPRDAEVCVAATIEGTEVRFSVSDRGRGIPQEKLHSIFERFQQVDATDSRDKGGSGLGLAICRSIVRQHGGEIWAESEFGCGSRFIFVVPRVQRASQVPAPLADRTVLVCEDDDIIREVEVELLEGAGYRAIGFASGEALLASDAIGSADAILLDMGLPTLDGWEVLAALRARRDTRDLPVVVVSGLEATGAHPAVAAWLRKPLDEEELLLGVVEALRDRQKKRRVLLVEDDLDLSRVLIESFDRLGLESFHASTGREAIGLARGVHPDLIVLDLALPELDGFGVVANLREDATLTHVPLVVYSAAEPNPLERDRLRLGPTQFLTKSRVSHEEFEQHIVRLLGTVVTPKEEMAHVA